MNKLAALVAAAVVTAGGSTAAYALVGTPTSTPVRIPSLTSESQSPKFVRTHDGVSPVDAQRRRKHAREAGEDHAHKRTDQPSRKRVRSGSDAGTHAEPGDDNSRPVGQTEPGEDHGNHAEPGDDHGDHAEPGDDHGNHAEPHDDHGDHAEPHDDHGDHAEPGDDHGDHGDHLEPGDDHGGHHHGSGKSGSDDHGGHGGSDDD